jgi:uncharacterized protein YuzE
MKVKYDKEVDVMYIVFSEKKSKKVMKISQVLSLTTIRKVQ